MITTRHLEYMCTFQLAPKTIVYTLDYASFTSKSNQILIQKISWPLVRFPKCLKKLQLSPLSAS